MYVAWGVAILAGALWLGLAFVVVTEKARDAGCGSA